MIKERIISELTRWKYHRPQYPESEVKVEPIPYLKLPFAQEDFKSLTTRSQQPGLRHKEEYSISEGWYYKKRTRQISGFRHAAVDFFLPYGFPVRAPCD